jgi:hypothetical protein
MYKIVYVKNDTQGMLDFNPFVISNKKKADQRMHKRLSAFLIMLDSSAQQC